MAERFRALGIKSVKICVYDLSLNPPPPELKDPASPMLIMIPAYSKKPPFIIYTDTPKVIELEFA